MSAAWRIAYAALLMKLDLNLSTTHKKRLLGKLARLTPEEIQTARVELAPAVEVDVGRLVGDAMDRAERYRMNRDAWIVIDEESRVEHRSFAARA
jgi:hypothetical protein